jgi:hypothetical protein
LRRDPHHRNVEIRETGIGRAVRQDFRQPAADIAEAEEEEFHAGIVKAESAQKNRAGPCAKRTGPRKME